MNTPEEARRMLEQSIQQLVEIGGATTRDLVDAGLTDYSARQARRKYSPHELGPFDALDVTAFGADISSGTHSPDDLVAVISPDNRLSRHYVDQYRAYIRADELAHPLRLAAKYLTYSNPSSLPGDEGSDGAITEFYPVLGRFRIGSFAAIPIAGIGSVHADALANEPGGDSHWPGPATLFLLGEPVPLGGSLFLGYKRTGIGTRPGVRRTLHYTLDTLVKAAYSGARLKGLPTA